MLVAAAGALAACSGQTATTRPVQASGGHSMLTEAELVAAHDRNLYDTIQRLRPSFLRSRQVQSNTTQVPEPVHVFVDGTRTEGLFTLRMFLPGNVKEVRFYEPHQANVKFGTGHHGGLIEVILKQ